MRFALGILVVLLAPALIAQSNDNDELIQLEHRWLQAIQQRDTAFLNALLDDRFVDTTPDGHLRTKGEALAAPVAQNVDSEKLENLVVRTHGDVAVVTGINVITGKGKSYTATVHFTDVFQKVQGHWKAIAAQENVSTDSH